MNQFVFVEFIVEREHCSLLDYALATADSFCALSCTMIDDVVMLSGRIDSADAAMIKIQDQFISDRMHISYISEELKNKYRY